MFSRGSGGWDGTSLEGPYSASHISEFVIRGALAFCSWSHIWEKGILKGGVKSDFIRRNCDTPHLRLDFHLPDTEVEDGILDPSVQT